MFATSRSEFFALALAVSFSFFSIVTDAQAQPWVRVEAGTTLNLNGVFGADSYALAAGANGELIRFDGATWSRVQTPTTWQLNAVWASSSSSAYIVGSAGIILRFDGVNATTEPFITSANLRGVWGTGDRVLAVGDNGTILQNEGTGWALVSHVTSRRLRAVGSSGDGAAFAAGDHGTILRFDGSTWSIEQTPTTINLHGIFVLSPTKAFAVGAFGTVLHYDGHVWQLMDTPTTLNLTAVWALSATQVYAVGAAGTILEFDGDEWRRVENVTTLNLNANNNGFIVGDFGTVLRNPTTLFEVDNLRITEVDPKLDKVEVTNEGPAFTSGELPFSHKLNHESAVPAGTFFEAGGIDVFDVSNLDPVDSDLWLYRAERFEDPSYLVHGVKWGPRSDVGETSTAVEAGVWPSVTAFTPVPPSGMSIAYDGFGVDPKDWYINETPSFGSRDVTEPGVVSRELFYPRGTQDFETVALGDEVFAIEDWSIESTSDVHGIFTARVVSDVDGDVKPRDTSTRWVRIRDEDSRDVENLVASPVIAAPVPDAYAWTFYVNIEELPANAEHSPAIMVQHGHAGAFVSTWGIAFNDDHACLVVTNAGGGSDSRCLGPTSEFAGRWKKVTIIASIVDGVVIATVDNALFAELPIDPSTAIDGESFRLAYVGSGLGNAATVLLDDVSVEAESVVVPLAVSASAVADQNDVVLSWVVQGDQPLDGFEIFRSVDGGSEVRYAGLLSPDTRRFEDNDLAADHAYTYVVSAIGADGNNARSGANTVRIERAPAVVFEELRTVVADGQVVLQWKLELLEQIDGFRIYRRALDDFNDVRVTGDVLIASDRFSYTDEIATVGRTYFYSVAAVKPDGSETRSGWSSASVPTPPMRILSTYPNPFTASTTVALSLSETGTIGVTVYDVQGRRVATLGTQPGVMGRNLVTWDGRDGSGRLVSAGTYFLKVSASGSVMTRKVVVVR